jgi:hypothetical protein
MHVTPGVHPGLCPPASKRGVCPLSSKFSGLHQERVRVMMRSLA